jgi:hypothetical protein
MSYKVENRIPPFASYDIVRVKETGELVIITEVNLNTAQDKDMHQWSFSITHINPESNSKTAWYNMTELEYVNNVFQIIAEKSKHPFSSSKYELCLKRRP